MASTRSSELNGLVKLEVPLIVRLGHRRMTMREVVSFMPGTILELPKNAEEELDLLVNNQLIGRGLAVKVGENFGVRITSIGPDVAPSAPAPRGDEDRSAEEADFADQG